MLRSITAPLLRRVQNSSGFKPCSEEIIKGISTTINLDELELYHFIDHVKQYVAAIKIAYRFPKDRRPFYELLGIFLEMFENIGGFNAKKYNRKIDEYVCTHHDRILASDALNIKIDSDPQFAHRLYQALSVSLVIRYNESLEYINHISPKAVDNIIDNETMQKIIPVLDEFKKLILKADKESKQSGYISDETTDKVLYTYRSLNKTLYNQLSLSNTLSTELKEVIGYRCQQEFLPYILLTNAANAMYSKPRGYAGDYLTIKMIYDNIPEGKTAVGALIDSCFLEEPAAKAVRNRKKIIVNEVRQLLENNLESTISITSLACGPAEEIFDVYTFLERTDRFAECIKE